MVRVVSRAETVEEVIVVKEAVSSGTMFCVTSASVAIAQFTSRTDEALVK